MASTERNPLIRKTVLGLLVVIVGGITVACDGREGEQFEPSPMPTLPVTPMPSPTPAPAVTLIPSPTPTLAATTVPSPEPTATPTPSPAPALLPLASESAEAYYSRGVAYINLGN